MSHMPAEKSRSGRHRLRVELACLWSLSRGRTLQNLKVKFMLKLCVCMLVLCLCVTSASAVCNSPQPRLVCAEFFREQVVVSARLARIRYVEPKDAMDYHVYTMQTDRVLRGNINPTFRIYEENSSGRASFEWK